MLNQPRRNRKLPLHREVPDPKKLELPPLAALDIETKGLGGDFIVGAIWTSDGKRDYLYSLAECLDYMLAHPDYLYLSHNGAGYEFAYLAPLIHDYFINHPGVDVDTLLQGDSRIVQIRLSFQPEETDAERGRGKPAKRKTVVLQDTLCLFSASLAETAKAFCPELPKLKGNINFEKEEFNPHNPVHMAYLDRDCEIVLVAYARLAADVAAIFGSKLGITAGSTALRAFKTTIPEGHCYYRVNKKAEAFIRKCYYGGLVLPGKLVGHLGAVAGVDINGAYAARQREHKYTVGNPYRSNSYSTTELGFYYVRATVPDHIYHTVGFNPVPHRDDKKGLSWPSGVFMTYMSTPEIEFARECDCTIEVIYGYVFPRSEYIFQAFIDKCQEYELKDNGKYKPTVKRIRNAGYGKFGAKDTHKVVKYSETIIPGAKPIMNEKNGEIIEGLYVYQEEQEAEYMLPHWAALVTAYERVELMRYVREAYKRGATSVYCDTDSLKADAPVILAMLEDGTIPVHKRYGGFKLEEITRDFIVLGSKCYYGKYDEEQMNLHHIPIPQNDDTNEKIIEFFKAKGIPKKKLKRSVYEDALRGHLEPIQFDSVKSTLSIIKEGKKVELLAPKRTITNIRHSYAWQVDDRGKITPRQDFSGAKDDTAAD